MFLISVYFKLITFFNRNSSLLQLNLTDFTPDLHLLDTSAMTEMQVLRLFYIRTFFTWRAHVVIFLARGHSVLMLAFSEI